MSYTKEIEAALSNSKNLIQKTEIITIDSTFENDLKELEEYELNENNNYIDLEDKKIEIPEEIKKEEYLVNLLNVYMCWYKQINNKGKGSSMFDNIELDDDESTNKCMECFYEEIFKFNLSKENDKD